MMQAVPVLKGPMTALKVPPTLQSLSGKEEEQHQAPQNRNPVNHAVKTTRDEPAQMKDFHQYLQRQEALFRPQLQQEVQCLQLPRELQHGKALLKDGAGGKEEEEMQDWIEPEDQRGQLNQRQTIPEHQEPIKQRLSAILQTEA